MALYLFGPEPGRILSVSDATESNCNARDKDRKFFAHKHVTILFGEDLANDIKGASVTACDFRLRADGGWQEIEAAIAAAPKARPDAAKAGHDRYWCQACAAYGDEACPTVGHRSERMVLRGKSWGQRRPRQVFERKSDGSLAKVAP